jgi:hypothetical protein
VIVAYALSEQEALLEQDLSPGALSLNAGFPSYQ